jgi:hypothetical protein
LIERAERVRSNAVNYGNLRVSRFVLALEMALCFVPLTFGWVAIMFDPSGVAWLDAATVERYYLGTTDGVAALTTMLVAAVIGLLGPVGLLVAARQIVFGRALRNALLRAALIAGPIVLGAVYVGANLVMGTEWSIEWFGFYVMFVALPLAGAAHLLYLGRTQPPTTLSAA